LAPYFEPYSEYLADRGYSQVSYWKKTFLISEFSRWLGKKRIAADAIIAECARRAKATTLLTFNVSHFMPFAGTGLDIVVPRQR
jgi:hypothetical protein